MTQGRPGKAHVYTRNKTAAMKLSGTVARFLAFCGTFFASPCNALFFGQKAVADVDPVRLAAKATNTQLRMYDRCPRAADFVARCPFGSVMLLVERKTFTMDSVFGSCHPAGCVPATGLHGNMVRDERVQ